MPVRFRLSAPTKMRLSEMRAFFVCSAIHDLFRNQASFLLGKMDMPLKPPLTLQQLKEIQERNPGNADVHALLWEIKRLHVILSRADQLARSLPDSDATALGIIVKAFRSETKDEPCLEEARKWRSDLLNPNGE